MDQKSEMIREDIDDTRSSLTQKLETLEGQLRNTVQGTIDSVKSSVRHLSPVYQTKQHPFVMVGAAVTGGLLAGRALRTNQPSRTDRSETRSVPRTSEYEDVGPASQSRFSARDTAGQGSLLDRFTNQFRDEIKMVKGMIVTGLLTSASDWAKKAAPQWNRHIDQVVGSALNKVGNSNPSSQNAISREGKIRDPLY